MTPVNNGNGLRGTAITLGVVAAVVIGVGLALLIFGEEASGNPMGGLLVRSGAVLGAVALVLPSVRKPSLTTVVIASAGVILVFLRPALIWVALAVWLGWLIWGRQRSTSSRES